MILADSTFLIDSLRKFTSVKKFLHKNPNEILFTTEINVFELYFGLYSSKILANSEDLLERRKIKLEELLSKFQVISIGRKEGIEAAKLLGNLVRIGKVIKFRDALVAGIAMSNGITRILTKNIDHFKRIDGIEVIEY
jgi:tRNA(fMet)-specific endonuclease VapC